ncbi:MAG: SLC13 family permease [Parvularculaceae bacterium]|nr:SLC13 family permease [Parvularculaceae bacterium]
MEIVDKLAALFAAYPWQMWASFVILAAAIGAFASERFSLELVSIATVAVFLVLFEAAPLIPADGGEAITTSTILEGFADPALLAIMCLLMLSQGLFQSGAMEWPTRFLVNAPARVKKPALVLVLLLALFASSFINDTPVVVMFLPIVAAIAAASRIAPSRVMMPLSYFALLGGMTTLIGSSTNILAAGVYHKATGAEIAFFDLTPMGAMIAGVGVIYMATIGRLLLPWRGLVEVEEARENKQFLAQFEIARGHFLLGKGPVGGLFPDLPEITVRMVQRREEAILPPYDDFRFAIGDIVIIAATRDVLTKLLKERPEILGGALSEVDLDEDDPRAPRAQLTLVEAVVAPASRMIGRTVGQIGFHYQTNCVILGVERRSRMIRTPISGIRLEAGDVLLILGPLENIRTLRMDRDVLMMEASMTGLPAPRSAALSASIFVGVVVIAALGILPIGIAAICGLFAMLAFGCLNIRQAARAFDRRIYLLIGGSLAMGHVLEGTGGAAFIGGAIAPIAENFGPAALLSAVFIMSAAVTNLLSNNATVALLVPIAISAAKVAGVDPWTLALTVIYGANCPFATPIGYQTNLLVMSPGHYAFRDYLKVGGPMLILIWFAYSLVAPAYFAAIGRL